MNELDERNARIIGIIMTLVVHACTICLINFTGLKYIYPPPKETTFLLDFEEEKAPQIHERRGRQPQAEDIDRNAPVELVQKSKSTVKSEAENLTPQTRQDNFGDVVTPAPKPKEEPVIDPRAAFPGMSKKDTSLTAPHGAGEVSEEFRAGQSKGNTNKGRADGKPNAHVKGRNTVGNIPSPAYNVQDSGTVVVNIWVDNYGNVVKAVPGGDGTTVTNKTLWAAARKAAMETHFNMSADAPAMQEGTITYIFNLK